MSDLGTLIRKPVDLADVRRQHYRIASDNLNQYRNGMIAMLCDLAVNTPDASLETLADIRKYLDNIEANLKLAKGEL